ncbi:hypothetical protein G6O67_005491 [Ophiocordyceps sinensis]|uniref:DUF7770 domain-containing protein n=2 Tax=Ophiocordyceps sinensis TaxID=72228 RepID=A0A8H4PRP6_9HYPO|nr:hypothetical protein OCS_03644 [Ophiocordyceps sinensis CO18]KAF4509205.1 hypothetical protein G6O67_005491 [Ophiocordyceps sinensis]
MDGNWDLEGFDDDDRNKPVVRVNICAYVNEQNAGDDDGNSPTNHWAIFLELPKQHSVSLDMAPGYGSDGRRGKILVSSRRQQITDNAIRTLPFGVAQGTSVQTITNVISTNNRQKYTFTEEMEGCRLWVYTIISDLETARIVDPGSMALTWEEVSYYWRYPKGHEARAVKQGEFRS